MGHGEEIIRFALELAGERRIRYRVTHDGSDSYAFKRVGFDVYEVNGGSERGVLYAVYDILAGREEGEEKPSFSIRGLNPCESLSRHTPEQLRRLIDRMGKWRMNTMIIHSEYGFEEHQELIRSETRKRGIELVHYTYYNLAFGGGIPRERFAKGRDGQPKPKGDRLDCVDRLCASDDAGLAQYARNVRTYVDSHPEYRRLLFATSDGSEYCECEQCRDMNPIAQWEPLFQRFYDNAPEAAKEALVYIHRFRVPDDLSRIRHLDRILYDLHLRVRREPLHDARMPGYARTLNEWEVDPRADGVPINRYLFDRLKEWRAAYAGKLYIFENLMVQGLFGFALPNTSVYLQDIRTFRREGIDGIVYEAYETGIRPFLPMFDRIAKAMWQPDSPYMPGEFETAYLGDLFGPEWPGDDYWRAYHEQLAFPDLYRLAAQFKKEPSWRTIGALMEGLLSREDRDDFDWLYIGFTGMHQVHLASPLHTTDPLEAMFLHSHKLWDFMNKVERPRETAGRLIQQIADRLTRTK